MLSWRRERLRAMWWKERNNKSICLICQHRDCEQRLVPDSELRIHRNYRHTGSAQCIRQGPFRKLLTAVIKFNYIRLASNCSPRTDTCASNWGFRGMRLLRLLRVEELLMRTTCCGLVGDGLLSSNWIGFSFLLFLERELASSNSLQTTPLATFAVCRKMASLSERSGSEI